VAEHTTPVSPFRRRKANDFNDGARTDGIDISAHRPACTTRRADTCRYDIFGSERYVLTTTTAPCATWRSMNLKSSINNDTYAAAGTSSASSARRRRTAVGQISVCAWVTTISRRSADASPSGLSVQIMASEQEP
jgi:hypothetical protein